MKIARENADRTPVSLSRIGLELESALAPDTCYVCDVDSGKAMDPLMSFGGNDKKYFATGPNILGWGMAAAFGVKLARPDQPVVSVVGDGSFCFSGPQPLWSQARYQAPIMNIVLNNHSYNNERNRIWHYGGRQFKTGRDMTCYIGSPDVDYVKAAGAFGVEAEVVKEPGELKAAIGRAQRVIADGRPYLLDVHTARDGIGAASTWHSPYSIADNRGRRV
jgi:thiamine pyrophosphate-dependent acetolactate synthase large subunit-like protein